MLKKINLKSLTFALVCYSCRIIIQSRKNQCLHEVKVIILLAEGFEIEKRCQDCPDSGYLTAHLFVRTCPKISKRPLNDQ